MGSAAVSEPALVADASALVPVAVGLDHRDGELAVHGWTEGSGRYLDDAYELFPTAAAFVITDIARDGMLGGPDVDGLAASVRAGLGAGDRQRGSGEPRRHRRTRRDRRAGRDHHRQGALRGTVRRRRRTRAAARRAVEEGTHEGGAGDPLPRRDGRPRREGHELRRPPRRRRPGGTRGALRPGGCRRVGLPRHHRLERQPRHHGRHGANGSPTRCTSPSPSAAAFAGWPTPA